MNTQHTPGPWRIGDAGNTIFGPKTDRPSPRTIATIQRHRLEASEDKANGRLIASAPRLLAELRGLVEQLDAIGIPDWHGAEGLDLDGAEIAIAEATGGDPAVIAKMRGDRAEVPLARNEKIAKEIRELSTIECAECGHCFLVGNSNPDLLAALERIADELAGIITVAVTDGEMDRVPSLKATRAIALTAIAKAMATAS